MTTANHDPIARIEQAYAKLTRAREIVAADQVSRVLGLEGTYWVASSTAGAGYLVQAQASCTCPDFHNRGDAERGTYCKHLLAVVLYQRNLAPTDTVEEWKQGVVTDQDQADVDRWQAEVAAREEMERKLKELF